MSLGVCVSDLNPQTAGPHRELEPVLAVLVTVVKVRPMRMCMHHLVVPMRVRVARRGRQIRVDMMVMVVVVPVDVHLLDRRVAMQVRMHAAEQE